MEPEFASESSGFEVAEWLGQDAGYQARLIDLAMVRFKLDQATAEDLLQDTAVELMRSPGPFRNPAGIAYRVFYTRCCQWVTRQDRRRRLAEEQATAAIQPDPPSPSPDLSLSLQEAISQLSPTCQLVLYCHYVEGRTLEETARHLQRGKNSISTVVSRCLERLREILRCQGS